MNPFLTIQSPDFGQFFYSSDPCTPDHSSYLDDSFSRPFLEDEPDDPSFTVDEVEQRLNNPVAFSVQKRPSDAPTPIELRVILKEKCEKFFLNRTPSPASTQASQPLLQDTPSTSERTRTPSMAEQFLMHLNEGNSLSKACPSSGRSHIKESCLADCTPVKGEVLELSSNTGDPISCGTSLMKISNSPVLLSSPMFKCTSIITNNIIELPGKAGGTPASGSAPVKVFASPVFLSSPSFKCSSTIINRSQYLKRSKPRQNLSRVRQRLQWNISPTVNKPLIVRKLREKQQILNMRRITPKEKVRLQKQKDYKESLL